MDEPKQPAPDEPATLQKELERIGTSTAGYSPQAAATADAPATKVARKSAAKSAARKHPPKKIASKTAATPVAPVPALEEVLAAMYAAHSANPTQAVRSQSFIKSLHGWLAEDLRSRLTDTARKDGVQVIEEATIFGAHKPKDIDVAVVHPHNGPLMIIGVRSQMGSLGNNAATYYQDIVGECISMQDRFPMSTIGYVYLHPLVSRKWKGKGPNKVQVDEHPDHPRWARIYNAITGREGSEYRNIRGRYDHFAYLVADFRATPMPVVRDDVVQAAVPLSTQDLRVSTFVDRMVETFKERELWLEHYFK
jgi:hypothetical protein